MKNNQHKASRWPRLLRYLSFAALAAQFCAAAPASANVIGTFTAARANVYSNFVLDSSLMSSAKAALVADGHSFVYLDNAITAQSLSGLDSVYLSLSSSSAGTTQILSAAEVSALQSYVLGGGNLVLQGDYAGYNNMLAAFGASKKGSEGASSVLVDNVFAPITDGPHGKVNSVSVAYGFTFNLPTGGINLNSSGMLGLLSAGHGLAAGAGNVVLFGEINTFDGPGNNNGFNTRDGGKLWRNVFELDAVRATVPEPGTLVLLLAALGCMAAVRRRPGRAAK